MSSHDGCRYYLRIEERDGVGDNSTVVDYREHLFKSESKCLEFLQKDLDDCKRTKNVFKKVEKFYADVFKWVSLEYSGTTCTVWQVSKLYYED